ncbi:MAG: hypothetical protein Q8R36_00705 [bacterium]|nr:hypothetical protein [bacterium]
MRIILGLGFKAKELPSIIFDSCELASDGPLVSPLAEVRYHLEGAEESHTVQLDLQKKKFLKPLVGVDAKKFKNGIQNATKGIRLSVDEYCNATMFGEDEEPFTIVDEPFQKDAEEKTGPTIH